MALGDSRLDCSICGVPTGDHLMVLSEAWDTEDGLELSPFDVKGRFHAACIRTAIQATLP